MAGQRSASAPEGAGGADRSNIPTHHISAMLDAHAMGAGMAGKDKLAERVAACLQCARACTACADACLAEDLVADLATCIRTDLDCAGIGAASGSVLSRQTGTNTGITRTMLGVFRDACAQGSAGGTPACMETAGSARRPAAGAKPLAQNFHHGTEPDTEAWNRWGHRGGPKGAYQAAPAGGSPSGRQRQRCPAALTA